MFPGPGARIYRNEAGEPIGWDYPPDEDYDERDEPGFDPGPDEEGYCKEHDQYDCGEEHTEDEPWEEPLDPGGAPDECSLCRSEYGRVRLWTDCWEHNEDYEKEKINEDQTG